MTTYRITGPDGKVYRVTGDGTAEEAMQQVRAQVEGSTPPPAAPAQEPSALGDFARGAKSSFDRAALGLKGLLPQGVQDLGDRVDAAMGSGGLTKETAVPTPDSFAGGAGAIGGDIAMAAAPGSQILKGANVLRKALAGTKAARLAAPTAIGTDIAGNAAVSAAMEPEDREKAGLLGGAGAAAGRVLTRALGGPLRGAVSPEAQTLIDAGIMVTPGKLTTGSGQRTLGKTLAGLEDKTTSVPVVGDIIKGAQTRGIEDFNKLKINEALAPIKGSVKESGLTAVQDAARQIDEVYERVKPDIFITDTNRAKAINDALQDIGQNIPLMDDGHWAKLSKVIDVKLRNLPAGDLDGVSTKQLDSLLGEMARDFRAGGPNNKPLGDAFDTLRNYWRQGMEGRTPEARQALKDADKAYAKLLPVEHAAQKSSQGTFTPKQFSDSVRKFRGPEDAVTSAARQVLPSSIPDSGTAGRQILGDLLRSPGGAGTVAAGGAALGGFGVPAALAAGMYTKTGSNAMTQGVHPLVRALRKGNYNPDTMEDILRNILGRGTTAAANQE